MKKNEVLQIQSFEELISLIESDKLNDEQVKTLLNAGLKVWFPEMPREELVIKLKEWWEQYQGNFEKPLFLD